MSMAWLTREEARSYSRAPKQPDMDTLSYWLSRLEPLIRAEMDGEIIVVLANRCGTEDDAVYAGTSTVLGIDAGEVKVYGILGRGEKELLVVDTSQPPQAKLVSEPKFSQSNVEVERSQVSEPRSDSTVSERSDLSSNLSVETNATTIAASPSPTAWTEDDMKLYGVTTPLSPVAPDSPSAFFASKGQRPEVKTVKSSKFIDYDDQVEAPHGLGILQEPRQHESASNVTYSPPIPSPNAAEKIPSPRRKFSVPSSRDNSQRPKSTIW